MYFYYLIWLLKLICLDHLLPEIKHLVNLLYLSPSFPFPSQLLLYHFYIVRAHNIYGLPCLFCSPNPHISFLVLKFKCIQNSLTFPGHLLVSWNYDNNFSKGLMGTIPPNFFTFKSVVSVYSGKTICLYIKFLVHIFLENAVLLNVAIYRGLKSCWYFPLNNWCDFLFVLSKNYSFVFQV